MEKKDALAHESNNSKKVKSNLWSSSLVNEVLGKHSHIYLFTCCLRLLEYWSSGLSSPNKNRQTCKDEKDYYSLSFYRKTVYADPYLGSWQNGSWNGKCKVGTWVLSTSKRKLLPTGLCCHRHRNGSHHRVRSLWIPATLPVIRAYKFL